MEENKENQQYPVSEKGEITGKAEKKGKKFIWQNIKLPVYFVGVIILFAGLLLILLTISKDNSKFLKQKTAPSSPTNEKTHLEESAAEERLQLIALLRKQDDSSDRDLFIFNPNNKTFQKINQEQAVEIFQWSADGRWLYWLAVEEPNSEEESKKFVYRTQVSNLNTEVILEIEKSRSLTPFKQRLQPLRDKNFLVNVDYDIKLYNQETEAETTLLEKKVEEDGIKYYSLNDVSSSEKYAIVQERDLEMQHIVSSGILNLETGEYQIVTTGLDEAPIQKFSPNDQYIIASLENPFGSEYEAKIYRFPSLELYRNISKIADGALTVGDFISDTLVVFPKNYQIPGEDYGLVIIDFENSKTVKFISQFEDTADLQGSCLVKANQNLIVFRNQLGDKNKNDQPYGEEVGYLVYDPDLNKIEEKYIWAKDKAVYDYVQYHNEIYLPAPQPTTTSPE